MQSGMCAERSEGGSSMSTAKAKRPHPVLHRVLLVLTSILLVVLFAANIACAIFAKTIDQYVTGTRLDTTEKATADVLAHGEEVAEQIEAEGMVLLQNKDNVLPLSQDVKQVNVFGWGSTQWLGGGSGSGRVVSTDTGLLQALEVAGISCNTELTQMYTDFQSERPYASNMVGTLNSWPEQSCRLYEPDINDTNYYTQQMLDNAKAYSDTAIVVLTRFSGESNDCPQVQYKQVTKDGEIITDETRTYLDLSTEEENLLTYVGQNYQNVIVLLNSGNILSVGQIETIPGVDACLTVGLTGTNAATAIPKVLWGEINPSGRTADTWAYDFATAASYANAGANGVGAYTNADGLYPADGTVCGNLGSDANYAYDQVSYVDYAEGIYVGYKWYETADAEGYWDEVSNQYGTGYDGVVQYPFGYGLSYTTFDWKVTRAPANGTALTKDGQVEVTVQVTNTGSVAGKDVVELYYTAPYITGEIEKSAVELAAFAKTEILEPGESQELTLTFDVEDMASYDYSDANHNGFAGYELDPGDYIVTVRHDAHTVDDDPAATITLNLAANTQYPTDSTTGAEVSNKFTGDDAMDGVSLDGTDSDQDIVYLTRADFAGTFPKENVDSRPMAENVAALNLYTPEMAQEWVDESDEPITTGAQNGLLVEKDGIMTELGYQLGKNYDDPQWDALLDQLTTDEMLNLTLHGYVKDSELPSIGKATGRAVDGPSQVGSFNQPSFGTGYPSSVAMAQTWNADLATEYGHSLGQEAAHLGYSGLYAPAVNMHRSPFNGRNYEYYSEDSYLSGIMCGRTVEGCKQAGIYCYVKHFLCNDGEAGIFRDGVYIWMTEQTIRETYLEPFRIMVEDYGATGLMTSYNRVGAVWAGGSEALLTGVLRDEWGFNGAVITDYSDHHVFMNGDQSLRAGGSLWMDGWLSDGTYACETSSNSFQQELRRASKNIIYMYLNARAVNQGYCAETGNEAMLKPATVPNFPVWKVALAAADVVVILLFVLALRAVRRDRKEKADSNAKKS